MVVKPLGNGRYTGLSTDTKPTPANTAVNAIFEETDTHNQYINNATAWVLYRSPTKTETLTGKTFDHISNTSPHIGGPNYTVLYDNLISGTSKYRLRNNQTGVIDASGTTLDAVVPTALAAMEAGAVLASGAYGKGGSLFIPSGRHILSGSFAGWDIPQYTRFTMAPNCALYIPDGYASYVLRCNATNNLSYTGTIIEGGYIRENAGSGPAALHDWTGIRLQCNDPSSTNSISSIEIRDTIIAYGQNGLEFYNNDPNGLAWINGCTFSHLWFVDNENQINFNNNGMPLNSINLYGFTNRNLFIGCRGQALDNSFIGVKDIIGLMNTFIDCTMWDYHAHTQAATARSSNIVGGASKTCFIGGHMTAHRFKDDVGDTIHIGDGRMYIPGVLYQPITKRWGMFTGTNTSSGVSTGLISGTTTAGTAAQVIDNTNGSRIRFTTGAAVDTPAGTRYAAMWTYRTFNPKLRITFALQQNTGQRLWIGFTGTNAVPSLDTWTDSKRFFGLALRAADTNWQIAHNDGTATTTWVSTGRAVNSSVHNLYLVADETEGRWGWMLDQTIRYPNWITTNTPGGATSLTFVAILEQSVAGAAKTMDIYNIEVESDK